MRIISYSTLLYIKKIAKKLVGSDHKINTQIDQIVEPHANEYFDQPIKIKGEEDKNLFDSLNSILIYPNCQTCNKPICGNQTVCECEQNAIFRREYDQLHDEIKKTEEAIQRLTNSAFRPLRNSYGSGAAIFGGINGIVVAIGTAVSIPVIVTATICLAAALPALATFHYVFQKDANEEKKILNDCYADAFHQTTRMRYQHIKSVKLRQDENVFSEIPFNPLMKKPDKEKRDILGNPFSHFLFSALATLGILSAIILKVGVVVGLASNPIGWGIAAAITIGVGCYFAYNRYQYLTNKIASDAQSDMLKHKCSAVKNFVDKFKKKTSKNENLLLQSQLLNSRPESKPVYVPKSIPKVGQKQIDHSPLLFPKIQNNSQPKTVLNEKPRFLSYSN